MLIDLTLELDLNIKDNLKLLGHFGTHFDVMNQVFPLDFTKRKAIIFDVSHIKDREIAIDDIDLDKAERDMFVGFCTKHIEEYEYGSEDYRHNHPQLSRELIDALLNKCISMIGIDAPGIRRGVEHTPVDQYCADNGVFVIENLINLKEIIDMEFIIHIYPMNLRGTTGLPCRVIAEL
ncbi:MAG: cyclase family protein [Erysipelotrichaceae bacterium]|nr:cyclase family protein [Erysipelotrichaceae bacterium]